MALILISLMINGTSFILILFMLFFRYLYIKMYIVYLNTCIKCTSINCISKYLYIKNDYLPFKILFYHYLLACFHINHFLMPFQNSSNFGQCVTLFYNVNCLNFIVLFKRNVHTLFWQISKLFSTRFFEDLFLSFSRKRLVQHSFYR